VLALATPETPGVPVSDEPSEDDAIILQMYYFYPT